MNSSLLDLAWILLATTGPVIALSTSLAAFLDDGTLENTALWRSLRFNVHIFKGKHNSGFKTHLQCRY